MTSCQPLYLLGLRGVTSHTWDLSMLTTDDRDHVTMTSSTPNTDRTLKYGVRHLAGGARPYRRRWLLIWSLIKRRLVRSVRHLSWELQPAESSQSYDWANSRTAPDTATPLVRLVVELLVQQIRNIINISTSRDVSRYCLATVASPGFGARWARNNEI